jgi:hypothetical protein
MMLCQGKDRSLKSSGWGVAFVPIRRVTGVASDATLAVSMIGSAECRRQIIQQSNSASTLSVHADDQRACLLTSDFANCGAAVGDNVWIGLV